MARSRRPLVIAMSGASRSACACRSLSQVAGAHSDGFRALHAGDAGGQFRRRQQYSNPNKIRAES
jgi:hypothetical protein